MPTGGGTVGHFDLPNEPNEAADTTVIEAKSIKIQTIDAIKCAFFISLLLSLKLSYSEELNNRA